MLGVIRVKTTEDSAELEEHAELLRKQFRIEATTRCIPDQPHGVYDDESEQLAIQKVKVLAEEFARQPGIDALTISCTADPALEAVRKIVDIPVFGAGECSAHAALMTGSRIGVLGITDEPSPELRTMLGDRLWAYRFSENFRRASSLHGTEAVTGLVREGERLQADGAQTILLDCTGFSALRLAATLRQHLQIPVIDPIEAQGIAYRLLTGY